ncbi:MAG: UvrD-helicase domain-containing protein [Chloroflexota bacterium]|nr:UvrD-helicase domain-containing protein [Chloroflexota bacterium]
MEPEVLVADGRARDALRTDFESTFFVDAGAGTGKTTAIVERIGELMAGGHVVMSQLVAITFTEAAAAELRTRVREALDKVVSNPDRAPDERDRCRVAGEQIGDGSIDTIHAFAGDLLRTYPLHAGLPPDFTTIDEIEADLDFEERFRTWFDHVADDERHRDTVRRALLLGLGPDRMQTLARALHENYDLLSQDTTWACDAPPEPIAAAHEAAGGIREAQLLLKYAPTDHKAIAVVQGLAFALERLAEASTVDQALVAMQAVEGLRRPPGTKDGWGRAGGENAFTVLKRQIDGVEKEAGETLNAFRTALFCSLLGALRDFVLDYAVERKKLGVATFQDLLAWARDLLRDNSEVRSRVQSRWARVFIDEFQDTDPLQAEIAFYLCADPGVALPEDWRNITLRPGKLCLVGDPKQSIYRFRRADIALYQAIRKHVAEPLVLSRNFRSVPAVIDFVNRHFGGAMKLAEGAQPAYQPLAPDAAAAGPALWRFGGPVGGKAAEVWELEAQHVAGTISRIVAEVWMVSKRESGERVRRPADFGDICVLTPSRTNLRRLERAFEDREIPYRVESGEIVVATQEVSELLSALRAIDDPSDQVALLAALRSPIYGCSDAELVRWTGEGGRLNYIRPETGKVDRVRAALAHMASFHAQRNQGTVAALVERFVDDRMLVAGAFGERRPRESWRRYRYVAARARAFAATGRTTLRDFVEWMEGLDRSQARDISGSITESDESAVRVLTVHRAKGLEFPIVFMTGLGSSRAFRSPTVIGDRVRDRVHARVKDTRQNDWKSPGFDNACEMEKELADAEEIRLAYVAATRACDHLIFGLHHKASELDAPAVAFAETLGAMAGEVRELELVEVAGPKAQTFSSGMTVEQVVTDEDAWVASRKAALANAVGVSYVTATARAALDQGEEPRPEPDAARFRRGRGGTSVGRAVHAVLQAIDLGTQEGLDNLARAQAAAEGIANRADDVARLVRQACESEPVRHAVASGRLWREVPIGGPSEGVVLEGFIDLLFHTDQGYEIVDYKTDEVRPDELESRMDRYRMQGEAYADLVRTITGKTPVGVSFVFASSAQVIRFVPPQPPLPHS